MKVIPPKTLIPHDTRLALNQLYEDYAEQVTSGSLERWPGFFTEDCLYRVMSRENYDAGLSHAAIYCDGAGMVSDRAAAVRDCTVYEPRYVRHFIGAIRVLGVEGEVIRSKASFLVVESVSDMQPYVHLVGEYFDKVVSGPDGLRFQERSCVYDNYRIFNSLIYPI
jgi:anthranilate 1,2-dioxygenase small subunit